VVGEGSEEVKLKKLTSKNIVFLKKLTDEELGYLYSKAEALIMPQEEDFGYTSVEAQFFGCPVVAYQKGGARETVIDGKTGIFFEQQNSLSLLKALERFHTISYNLKNTRRKLGKKNVEKFSKQKFVEEFSSVIEHATGNM
jgi:glycosyltransferase involved in cell wall biosynthesis